MILKNYVKSHMKSSKESNVKSYMHYSKYGLVTIWHVGLVFGVWSWEILGMCPFCTVGASCKAVAAAG